ncbi:putative DNA-binding transcriptional regulator AlpA [Desulfosalsimonas propionicica]|uniref:Putative DNA-binding transcriptional regulator AlpA n=1 Tax=Desulfosalsimonas propionicica TaxID=332175 RepID=A0A7W0HMA2_9BACT|nr:hypothetical protein [Desulfosalsimonas propionicica]MBA2883160.1 putative DNA-binding transcriptional regulator AlpA [Desulfosalsimonas propionicica]
MRDKKSQKYPAYLTYQLYVSSAFRKLRPAAKDILILAYYEIIFPTTKGKPQKKGQKYTFVMINRDEIILSYNEIKDRLGYSEKTIWESFKQILAHGFLKVVKQGGGNKGDYQVYGITEDWRKWSPGDVVREIQINGKYGRQKHNPKKISGTTGKPLHGTAGKPVIPKNKGGLPTSNTVSS